jgi:hypothetical protein
VVGSLGLELEEPVTTSGSASARDQHVWCR